MHLFGITVLLRYNSHLIQSTYVKCTIQQFSVYPQSCVTITIFSSVLQKVLYSPAVIPSSLFPPTALGKHESTFCFYTFAPSGHFTYLIYFQYYVYSLSHTAKFYLGSEGCNFALTFSCPDGRKSQTQDKRKTQESSLVSSIRLVVNQYQASFWNNPQVAEYSQ